MPKSWYTAKCIFVYSNLSEKEGVSVYEERVILFMSSSFEQALQDAEEEAEQYALQKSGCYYTGFINVFHLFSNDIQNGTEVYSLMRSSVLPVKEYIDTFYDTGYEHTDTHSP